jgi:hypothetical protein
LIGHSSNHKAEVEKMEVEEVAEEVAEEAVEDQEARQRHHHFHQMLWSQYPPQLI